MTTRRQITIDVWTDIGRGETPCDRILQAAEDLHDDEELRILVPFKPVPLVDRLAEIGLIATLTERIPGEWQLLAHRTAGPAPAVTRPTLGKEEPSCPAPMTDVGR